MGIPTPGQEELKMRIEIRGKHVHDIDDNLSWRFGEIIAEMKKAMDYNEQKLKICVFVITDIVTNQIEVIIKVYT